MVTLNMNLYRFLWSACKPGRVSLVLAADEADARSRILLSSDIEPEALEGSSLEIVRSFVMHFMPAQIETEPEESMVFDWLPDGIESQTLAPDGALPAQLSESRFNPDLHWSDEKVRIIVREDGYEINPRKDDDEDESGSGPLH